jgi:biotin transport system substrate-specific component
MSSIAFIPATIESRRVPMALAVITGGVLLIALAAQVVVPLPFTPVPITGQTFAVLLVGAAGGLALGSATLIAYLAVGALGAPVLAQGAGGLAPFVGPSAGYLAGMVLAAALVGLAADKGWDRRVLPSVVAMAAASALIYGAGLLWLGHSLGTGARETLLLGFVPFLVGDALKLALAASLLPLAWRIRRSLGG